MVLCHINSLQKFLSGDWPVQQGELERLMTGVILRHDVESGLHGSGDGKAHIFPESSWRALFLL
jgi:hypothetical protein